MDVERQGAGKPLSKVEAVKEASRYLLQYVADEVKNGATHFSEDAATILKFHGTYQQDDRDTRTQMKREGKEKAFEFMVRVAMPGGVCTAAQYLALDGLARTEGSGTLRITTRQEIQIHGVLKVDLASTIRAVNESLLSTLSACGDVKRNTLACPAPIRDAVRDAMQADAARFNVHFSPRSSSYYDIWLDGEKVDNPLKPKLEAPITSAPGDDPVEPIYGTAYLPRKFKTAFSLPEDNCTDILANDLGYLAIVEDGVLVGYNVVVGGGLGTTPSADKTFPYLAKPMAFVPRESMLEVGEGVLKVYRDFGNRSDRKRARLKYIIHDWGIPAFRAKVEEYLGHPLDDPRAVEVSEVHDHLGWHEQGDGKLWLGVPIENGRVKDEGPFRLMSGLRAYFERYGTPARFTCQQKVLLVDIDPAHKAEIERLLKEHGIARVEDVTTVRRWSMACVAFPTVRAGRDRGRAGALPTIRRGPARKRSCREPRARVGSVHRPDDRLPERVRPAVQLRHRPRRPIGVEEPRRHPRPRHLHDLPRRPDHRRPAQRRVQGLRPVRPGRRRARPRPRALQGGAGGRRDLRRLLSPRRRRGPRGRDGRGVIALSPLNVAEMIC